MSFVRSARLKQLLLGIWIGGAALIAYALLRTGIPVTAMPDALRRLIFATGGWGPALYILLYVIRPLILFPASILTIASGLVWGPLLGTAYTLVGENLSAASAFWLARYFGRDWAAGLELRLLKGVDNHLQEHGFITVMILRLAFLPFDPVNFACGITGMRFRDYAAGTFFGIVPGAVSFVYFGSAWYDRRNLLIAALAFAAGLAVAHLLNRTRAGSAVLEDAKKK